MLLKKATTPSDTTTVRYGIMDGFDTFEHGGWKGLACHEWNGRIDDLETWLETHPGQQLVNRPTRTVRRVVENGEEVYVKVVKSLDGGGNHLLSLWKCFKWRFLENRAMATLAVTAAMESAGVRCAGAVLAARRTYGFSAEEVFISRGVPHPSVLKIMSDVTDNEKRMDILHGVARGLCDFHCHGFIHGDCIPGNLLWDGEHVHFIDNDRTCRADGCLLQRGIRRNLVQFCFRLSWNVKNFDLAEHFLACYAEAMNEHGQKFDDSKAVMEKTHQRYKLKEAEQG
ncbi:MAG: lipopolysaccharide kinase InaA family protein [Lentisphaeria bacterium]|nr:lipopolysaccharide kinase InaA family protein [Lentisphaeria bacterium]